MSAKEVTPSLEELVTFMDDEQDATDIGRETVPPAPEAEPEEETEEGDVEPVGVQEDQPEEPEEGEPAEEDEPEETEVEPQEEESDETPAEEGSSEGSPYQAIYDEMMEQGALFVGEDFEFDGTAEGLQKAINYTKQNLQGALAQNLWQSLPEDFKPALEYALAGGTDIQGFLQASAPMDVENVNLENVSEQRRVMQEFYTKTTQYSPERIQQMIERHDKAGTLQEDAETALEDLRGIREQEKQLMIQEAAQRKAQIEEQQRQFRRAMAQTIEKSDFIAKPRKNKVRNFLFNVLEREDGQDTDFNRVLRTISQNPEHLAQLADVLYDYSPDEGLSLKRVEKSAEGKAAKSLKQRLDAALETKAKVTGRGSKVTKSDSFDWEEWLKQN